MYSFYCTLFFAFLTFSIHAQTGDSVVQVYWSDSLIECINYSLPRIVVDQKKNIRKVPKKSSYFDGLGVIDGVYVSVTEVCKASYVKPIKIIYRNRIGDIYRISDFCGINFNERDIYFYANGSKKHEEIVTEECKIYKKYVPDGSLERFDKHCEIEQGGCMIESKNDEYYRLKTEDSTVMIYYFENGKIKSREVSSKGKSNIDYWDDDACYIGSHFYLARDSFKIRHDISLNGDTVILEGWMKMNPITLQEEYYRNK